jgi:hypothetical protein
MSGRICKSIKVPPWKIKPLRAQCALPSRAFSARVSVSRRALALAPCCSSSPTKTVIPPPRNPSPIIRDLLHYLLSFPFFQKKQYPQKNILNIKGKELKNLCLQKQKYGIIKKKR